MNEPLFGSGAPMWTAAPSTGIGYQVPFGTGSPLSPALFGGSTAGAAGNVGVVNGVGGTTAGTAVTPGAPPQVAPAYTLRARPRPDIHLVGFVGRHDWSPGQRHHGYGVGAIAADGGRDATRSAAWTDERSGSRGLHLRCARTTTRHERSRGPLRVGPRHAERHRSAEAGQARHR